MAESKPSHSGKSSQHGYEPLQKGYTPGGAAPASQEPVRPPQGGSGGSAKPPAAPAKNNN